MFLFLQNEKYRAPNALFFVQVFQHPNTLKKKKEGQEDIKIIILHHKLYQLSLTILITLRAVWLEVGNFFLIIQDKDKIMTYISWRGSVCVRKTLGKNKE